MPETFFNDISGPSYNPDAILDISGGGKVLIISDFHMGSGRRDDLEKNSGILRTLLENYYYTDGWILVLNGDIEELAKYSLREIRGKWGAFYRIFDNFAWEKRLYKVLGNHDKDLVFEKNYPYPLYSAVRIETGIVPVYVYHGHQSSKIYTKYDNLVHGFLKYFLKPLGIRNIKSARSPHRRFKVEREAYNFSIKNNCISVIGHTHRALFESLGRFDYIKFEIERLCRDYPSSTGADRERIEDEVKNLRQDLSKLKRSERRDVLRQSLYGDELPVPCLFNSGSVIGTKGIYAIELDRENISLVYWFTEGKGMKFINRGAYKVDNHASLSRTVLNHDRLDHVKAKIELLGK